MACGDCGRYLKKTADYTIRADEQGRRHPDNDPSIMNCNRCSCPAEAHEAVAHEQERELGNDAFALGQYDAAIAHYARALHICGAADATLFSNRAAAYLAKGWPQQALHDADHALALRPDYPKAWGRKGAALLQLGQFADAAEAYQRGLQLDPISAALREGLEAARTAERKQRLVQARVQAQAGRAATVAAAPRESTSQAGGREGMAGSGNSFVEVLAPARPARQQHTVATGAAAGGGIHSSPTTPPDAASLLNAWHHLQQKAAEAQAAVRELQRQSGLFEAALREVGLLQAQPVPPSSPPACQLEEEDPQAVAAERQQQQQPETASSLACDRDGQEACRKAGIAADDSSASSTAIQPESSAVEAAVDVPPQPSVALAEEEVHSSAGNDSLADAAAVSDRSAGSDSDVEDFYSEVPAGPCSVPAAHHPTPNAPAACSHELSSGASQWDSLGGAGSSFVHLSASGSSSSGSGSRRGSSIDIAVMHSRPASACSSGSSEVSSSSDSTPHSSLGEEDSGDADWLAAVEAARRQLAEGPGQRLAPPTSAGRRQPKISTAAQNASSSDGAGVGIDSLKYMLAAAEAAGLARDANGTSRAACKRCSSCPRFFPVSVLGEAAAVAALLAQQQGGAWHDCCAVCGCPGSVHENTRELTMREGRLRREQQRRQRQSQQQSSNTSASASSSAPPPLEAADDRQQRVAAAAERRTAAEAAGEQLQEVDSDVLTQQRRTTCGGCTACPGFRVLFRSSDANDPQVMFFCSMCGCRADQHAVDSRWLAEEAARRAAEAAAAERRAAAAALNIGAAAVARQAEADAYATLGLPLGADAKSVARAYKRLALQLHPDKQAQAAARLGEGGGGFASLTADKAAAAARVRFDQVTAAYKFLSKAG